MAIMVHRPRLFVAQWLRFHKLNVIIIKELFYLHKKSRSAALALTSTKSGGAA
jgi:hypothetical protein